VNKTDQYHVYSGFVVGVYVANEIMRGALGFRSDDILKQLAEISRDETSLNPSGVSLINSFPLSQEDHRFDEQCHPILKKAAAVVLEFRSGDSGGAGSSVPA
jgi:hypothetical protein